MIQAMLFDEPKKKIEPNMRCRNCIHCVTHEYNSSMKYCEMGRQRGTAYGLKKIKALDLACEMFEAIEK